MPSRVASLTGGQGLFSEGAEDVAEGGPNVGKAALGEPGVEVVDEGLVGESEQDAEVVVGVGRRGMP